jgi:hypothetical protein
VGVERGLKILANVLARHVVLPCRKPITPTATGCMSPREWRPADRLNCPV